MGLHTYGDIFTSQMLNCTVTQPTV